MSFLHDLTVEDFQEQLGVDLDAAAYLTWIAQLDQPTHVIATTVVETLQALWGPGTWPEEAQPLIVFPYDVVNQLIEANVGLAAFDDEHAADQCYEQTAGLYTRSLDHGLDEEAATAAQDAAQDECTAELYRTWQNAVESILSRVLSNQGFGLDLSDGSTLSATAVAHWLSSRPNYSADMLRSLWAITPEFKATWLTILWRLNNWNGDNLFEGVVQNVSPRDLVLLRLPEIIRQGEADYGTTIKRMWRNAWR